MVAGRDVVRGANGCMSLACIISEQPMRVDIKEIIEISQKRKCVIQDKSSYFIDAEFVAPKKTDMQVDQGKAVQQRTISFKILQIRANNVKFER